MVAKQLQFDEIVSLLNKAAPILISENLNGSAKDTEKLINRIKGFGSISSSHKDDLYSILRMMFEANTYYASKAGKDLDRAFVLIKQALTESV